MVGELMTIPLFPEAFLIFLAVMVLGFISGYCQGNNNGRSTSYSKGHIAGRIKGYSECTEEVKALLDQYKKDNENQGDQQ
jgi:hypothetical protein